MTEKLLTLKEAADYLGLPEQAVRRLVEKGEIPAYQIGGMYLRFREDQILSLRDKYRSKNLSRSKKTNKENFLSRRPFFSRFSDFFYFNDFYILSALLIAALVYIILESIR